MKTFETEATKQVVNTIRLKGLISQTQLAQLTGFSQGTVSNVVKRLLKDGWIQEKCRTSNSGRGRPCILLSVNPDSVFAIGIDVGGQNLRVGLVNLAGEILDINMESTRPKMGPEDILQRTREMARRIIARSSVAREKIGGLGFALSGIIDPEEGVCLFCPNLPGWIDVRVREFFSEEFGNNVMVDDSVRMMALAEKCYRHGRNMDNLIYIGLGVGIGCAIFIHGELYRGHTGLAGEFGHITVDETGPLCQCGNSGCLEAVASANAITQRAWEAIQSGVYSTISAEIDEIRGKNDVKAIFLAAKEGDKLAFDVLDKTGEYIGIGIAALINLFNPSAVVVGGGVAHAGEILMPSIERAVRKRALGMLSRTVPLQQSQLLDKHAGVIGGATAIFNKILNPT